MRNQTSLDSVLISGFVMNLYLISSDWQFEIVIDKKERKISHENHESMGQGVCGDSWGEFQPSQSPSSIKSAKIYIPWSRWTLAESTCDSSWLSSSSMCSMSFSILPGSLLTLTSSQDKGESQSEISQIYISFTQAEDLWQFWGVEYIRSCRDWGWNYLVAVRKDWQHIKQSLHKYFTYNCFSSNSW